MKQFCTIFCCAVLFSCSEDSKDMAGNPSISLSYELDTVMVDAGDDLIYLINWLHWSEMSKDETILYNFDDENNKLEVIDMEKLRLSHKIPFEAEGPNGTGRVIGFQNLENGKFLLANFTSMGIFNEKGQKTYSYKYADLPANLFEQDEQLEQGGTISDDGKTYYTFYNNGGVEVKGIAKLDMESGDIKRIPISQLEALDRFTVKIHNEYQFRVNLYAHHISWHQGKLLISNSVENQIIIYHPEEDSLSQHLYQSQLTADFAKELLTNDLNTEEEFHEFYPEFFNKEVFFGQWIYDPSKERFYRLTYLFENEIEDQKYYKVFLTILDKNFNQIYEGITPVKKQQGRTFMKDGKLYVYENLNDELGFLVLSMNEN